MAKFPARIQKEAKEKSAFKCCLCHLKQGTHVHHIDPPNKGGFNEIENAAPMCAGCHDEYGHDPSKRKHIRWARDWWFKLVEINYTPLQLEEIRTIAEVHKGKAEELESIKSQLKALSNQSIEKMTADTAPSVASSIFSFTGDAFIGQVMGTRNKFESGTVQKMPFCKKCGNVYFASINNRCPHCDAELT
jgi:predicted Zn-ribbon and HTH transcriptional regulator